MLIVALAGAYQFWFRNSAIVAVTEVQVVGMDGPEADEAKSAFAEAAGQMTTLNVDQVALDAVAASFATVAGVEADSDFPHGLTISVDERPPVLLARAGETVLPVAGDGTILEGVDASKARVPEVEVDGFGEDGSVTGDALDLATVAGAAPTELRRLIVDLGIDSANGLTVTLKGGVPVIFGDSTRAEERWVAAAAVLADPQLDNLTYLDVRVPERPAIGGAATIPGAETTTP